ncbi:GNAT family N-acetyltransferase [Nocardiopsis sp. CNT312]|uniref:GNAT family N-acetyltransferase n=1 Tax=Nocardiopsis sp. CNT312 TaxID=1137268 RepID=UPI000563FAAE|nr:GNAT family N-acetyltransferase [Nocardiopsis sp. CNT312]
MATGPEFYYVQTQVTSALGDTQQALFALPCDPSTPGPGATVRSEGEPEGGAAYGTLLWSDAGVLYLVGVVPQWRRQGIATALWKKAREISELPLDRAPLRTALGEAWMFYGLGIDAPLEQLNGPFTSRGEAIGAEQRQLALDDEEATAERILALLGAVPEALPHIRAMCAPTQEDAFARARKLQQGES